MYNTLSSMARD